MSNDSKKLGKVVSIDEGKIHDHLQGYAVIVTSSRFLLAGAIGERRPQHETGSSGKIFSFLKPDPE